MICGLADDLVLYAPIEQDDRFVEFKIQYKMREEAAASSWSLVRTVVDYVPPESQKYIAGFPVGGGVQYQENTPRFLRNLTIIDSRPPGASRFKQEHGDVYFDLLSPLLREVGVGHVYVATNSAVSIAENAASFSSSGTVVILGGDTSAHEFVNALEPITCQSSLEIRLVIVPTGTGNALATSVGLTSAIHAVRRLFLSKWDDFVPLSTFKVEFPSHESSPSLSGKTGPSETSLCATACNEKTIKIPAQYALVVASWGLHSSLVADSDTDAMRKKFASNPNERFKEAARLNLETIDQNYKGEVTGGVHFGPNHSYLLFTTVTHLESAFCISPNSHPPSSNELHMVAIKPLGGVAEQNSQLMEIMQKVYDGGKHVDDVRVTYAPVRSDVIVTVDKDQPEHMRRWCIDGHIIMSPPGQVVIHMPTHKCKGWSLKILPGES